jgi:hypothetical protein
MNDKIATHGTSHTKSSGRMSTGGPTPFQKFEALARHILTTPKASVKAKSKTKPRAKKSK